jgi:UDP-N-acetylglucosamine acyltransferase
MAGKYPLSYCGINIVGLRRRGFTIDQIERIKEIYKTIYQSGLNISDACKKVEAEFEETVEKRTILDFIKRSKRGIIKDNIGAISDED